MRRENQGSGASGGRSRSSGRPGPRPTLRKSTEGQRTARRGPGRQPGVTSGRPAGKVIRLGRPAPGRSGRPEGRSSATAGAKTPGRRITLGEQRARAYQRKVESRSGLTPAGKGKKLVLKGEKRASRSQLLRELGHTTERQETRHSVQKSELIRLNRFISNAGICSRREADKYIEAGVVKVNGQTVTELGVKVSPDDEVRFDNRLITPERKVYILLNKPKEVVTTMDDPHAEHTVMDLVKGACEERIYPVGRLDRNTTGLLLLTNDGELSKRLTHPSHNVAKVYQVTLDKVVSIGDMQKIADGVELEDGHIAADAITYVEGQDKETVGVEIHSGRHRVVRRIFEHLGYRVRALDRVSFAGLTKKNIPRGKWRFLSPREVSYLKMK